MIQILGTLTLDITNQRKFDYDLTLVGGTNVFTTLVDSDNVKWELDLTGDGNDFNTTQKDADQSLVVGIVVMMKWISFTIWYLPTRSNIMFRSN